MTHTQATGHGNFAVEIASANYDDYRILSDGDVYQIQDETVMNWLSSNMGGEAELEIEIRVEIEHETASWECPEYHGEERFATFTLIDDTKRKVSVPARVARELERILTDEIDECEFYVPTEEDYL